MNDFLSKMFDNVFGRFRPQFQIPEDIPLRKLGKKENRYSGRIADIGFYEPVFIPSLRLPLTELRQQLVDYLSVSVSQIYPNVWRIFIGAKVLPGQMSGGCH